MQVLILNPGATSTKISVFDETGEIMKRNIAHDPSELSAFLRIIEQKQYRYETICRALEEAGFSLSDFSAVCGRGGLLKPIPSGTYLVNDAAVADIESAKYGEHASNLGALLARELADQVGIPAFFVDPVCTDELEDVARISGFAPLTRISNFHALNHKSTARKAADEIGKPYEELNLIVCHMGGGVSVAAHKKGRVVDVYNVRDEGAFSLDRGGSLPLHQVIDYCYSGISKEEVRRKLTRESGVFSYLGTTDFRFIEERVLAGDEKYKRVAEAMLYQLCKDMGAMAAALRYELDGIVLTGGMANSHWLCSEIRSYMKSLCPIFIYPGEEEMRSLAEGAFRVLYGEEAKVY